MSGWLFDGANPIVSFTVGVELSGSIPPHIVREISARHHLFKRDLPRRIEQPFLMFPMPGVPIQPQQNQIAGVAFDSVRQDGTVARSLVIGPNQIAYMTADYTRWKEFQPVLERVIDRVLDALTDGPQVIAFLLTVVNAFQWSGAPSEAALSSLLNSKSKMYAPNVLKITGNSHSHHGFVEKREQEPQGQYIRNVNIQTGDDEHNVRHATILLSHRLLFDKPRLDTPTLFKTSDNELSFAAKLTTEMHDVNNGMFQDVVSAEIGRKIVGLSA